MLDKQDIPNHEATPPEEHDLGQTFRPPITYFNSVKEQILYYGGSQVIPTSLYMIQKSKDMRFTQYYYFIIIMTTCYKH